jgi:hypothetical protein
MIQLQFGVFGIEEEEMKKRLWSMLLVIAVLTCACQFKAKKPYMTDRTSGWDPAFNCEYDLTNLYYETDHSGFYCFLFRDSQLTHKVPLPDLNMTPEQIMEYGLRLAFEDRYIDIGEEEIHIEGYESEGLRLYCAGSTMLILDTNDNAIVQCIDVRLQPYFAKTEQWHSIVFQIDLAQLTAEEVKALAKYTPPMEGRTYQYKNGDLPLSPEKAFQVTANDIFNQFGDNPGSGGIGSGEYKVYDCERSNSWLILGKGFTQMLDKDTGERLLLTWAVKDLSTKA